MLGYSLDPTDQAVKTAKKKSNKVLLPIGAIVSFVTTVNKFSPVEPVFPDTRSSTGFSL